MPSMNLYLLYSLTKRDLESRYKSSSLGALWILISPLILLAIYSFVFGFVFKSKWNGHENNYALVMFSGLLVHLFFADCISRATTVIQNNANYVKKVNFPLEILCMVVVASSLFQFLVSMMVFWMFYFLSGFSFSFGLFQILILIFPMILLGYGIVLFLSSLGVYIRDMAHAISLVISIMLFMSPVFYPMSAVPEEYRDFLYFNPSTFIIEELRMLSLSHAVIDWFNYIIYFLVAIILVAISKKIFSKLKVGFSDVL